MGKGSKNQKITNVQALPPAVEAALEQAYTNYNPFDAAFQATSDFNPEAYGGPTMAGFSALQNAALNNAGNLVNRPDYINQAQDTFQDFAQGNTGIGFDPTNLQRLSNQAVNTSNLQSLFSSVDPAVSQLQNLSQQTTSLDPLAQQQNQQNLATGLLGQLAVDGGTNPYLQQQLDGAISGAVDKATSQYALGGRLGSDSFAGALGAGVSNAAAPILAQNLQQDRQNQLAAAQALGSVSGDDLSRNVNVASNLVRGGQTNLSNQVDATRALSAAFGQNLGQNTDIANNLIRADQADLARQLSASGTLSGAELDASRAASSAQLDAASRLPGLLSADQSRISTLQDLGAMQQAPAQAAIDAERARVGQQNALDQNRINALLAASGMGQGMFGTTSTQTGGGPGALSSGLGGALAGASLANTLAIPGITASMGGIGGGLLGLLAGSDNRLKEDVELLGKHPNGLNVYRWKWNKTAKRHHFEIYPTEGFMAQEARKLYPEHVYRHPTGFLMLDYAALSNEVMGAI
tara:strand:- start:281 stop:1843 length:1563 start_codon:yes stop_codon:yes gene_type:complete